MLNPLAIAHLGIARRPIVAALLGLWDALLPDEPVVDEEEDYPRFWGPPMRSWINQNPRRRREECALVACGII